MTPADKIALEMREAAEKFNHRPQSMRGRAFADLLNSFETASTSFNVLAILDDRDALKARFVELELAAIRAVIPLEAFSLNGRLDERFGAEAANGIREGIAAVRDAILTETKISPPAGEGERAR